MVTHYFLLYPAKRVLIRRGSDTFTYLLSYLLGGAFVEAEDAAVNRLDVVDRRPRRRVDDVVRLRRPLPREVVPDVPFCPVSDKAIKHHGHHNCSSSKHLPIYKDETHTCRVHETYGYYTSNTLSLRCPALLRLPPPTPLFPIIAKKHTHRSNGAPPWREV